MKRYAIFSGTFDPFTPAHIEIVNVLADDFDKVIVVPSVVNWYRKDKSEWLTASEKIDVINTALKFKKDNVDIDLSELKLFGMCKDSGTTDILINRRFIDILLNLQLKYSCENEEIEWYFTIGSD